LQPPPARDPPNSLGLLVDQVKQVALGCHRCFYFVNIGLVGVGGVAAAGETLNVSQRFQPAGRFSLANSP
jgi:hypothetical protein